MFVKLNVTFVDFFVYTLVKLQNYKTNKNISWIVGEKSHQFRLNNKIYRGKN